MNTRADDSWLEQLLHAIHAQDEALFLATLPQGSVPHDMFNHVVSQCVIQGLENSVVALHHAFPSQNMSSSVRGGLQLLPIDDPVWEKRFVFFWEEGVIDAPQPTDMRAWILSSLHRKASQALDLLFAHPVAQPQQLALSTMEDMCLVSVWGGDKHMFSKVLHHIGTNTVMGDLERFVKDEEVVHMLWDELDDDQKVRLITHAQKNKISSPVYDAWLSKHMMLEHVHAGVTPKSKKI